MALTDYYVDPAINANSGTGTIGDPFGDLQYALNTVTRDATNGDRFNIKSGTAEVMAAAISLATYGTPTAAAPLIFQGYTSAAADGGIGEINNGGANVSVMDSAAISYVSFIDMRLGNTGTAMVIRLGSYCTMTNCEVHTATGYGVIINNDSVIMRCKISTQGGVGIQFVNGGALLSTYIAGSYSSGGVYFQGRGVARDNIFHLSGAGRGLVLDANVTFCVVANNSFYSSAGTGIGLRYDSINLKVSAIINNIFTGFSGAGGIAISGGATKAVYLSGANAFYNNTTNKGSVVIYTDLGDIALTNAPFTDPGAGDFSIAAAAKAELQAQGWPSSFLGISTNQYLDPGAAQIQIPAAGGLLVHPGMSGGMRG